MKRFRLAVLILVLLPITFSWSEEVYCRYEAAGAVHYGRVEGGVVHQLDKAPWEGGQAVGQTASMKDVRLLHPSIPQKIFGISGSYKEAWAGGKKPFNTIRWFLKPPSAAASPDEDVILPASLDELEVETELVLVIGKRVKDAGLEEAKEAIFGYTVGNDIVGCVTSYHQVNGEPLDQAETLLGPGLKIGDGFAPFGPFIHRGVDWRNRERTLKVSNPAQNKELTYQHNTSNMLFPPEKIVSDLSRVCVLEPGDIIFTGTTKSLPARAGDVMEVSVEGLGTLVNKVKAAN
ncbi:MAG: fumarylacetoacetate hydrolase family protein [bacterium]